MNDPVPPRELEAFQALLRRREDRVPMAYLTGSREFWSLEFEVDPRVLIPRPETEHVVEHALRLLKGISSPRIADIGTGAGPIAVALATELPGAGVEAVDLSAGALEVARRNARRHGVESRIRFHQGDGLEPLRPGGARFHLVATNPPYVGRGEEGSVQEEVKRWEPGMAVFAGPRGDEVIRRIIPQAAELLVPGGHMVMEMTLARVEGVRALFQADGRWTEIADHPDLAGLPRVFTARRREEPSR
jgi:release factor glutamine methyltransferase